MNKTTLEIKDLESYSDFFTAYEAAQKRPHCAVCCEVLNLPSQVGTRPECSALA